MNSNDIPALAIAGYELKTVPEYGVLLISFSYLSHATQPIEQAQQDRTYVIHRNQLRELAQKISEALAKLENCASQEGGSQKH